MDAVVSGRAGVALVLDGQQAYYLRSGAPVDQMPCAPTDFRWLFGDASDLRFLPDVSAGRVAGELETAADAETALHLTLGLLDPELTDETRDAAAEEMNVFLASSAVTERLESVLFAAPLPSDTDVSGAMVCAQRCEAVRVVEFVTRLTDLQGAVAAVRENWDNLPNKLFGSETDRAFVRNLAVRAGLFRSLVRCVAMAAGADQFLMEGLQHPDFRAASNHRDILRQWAAAFPRSRHDPAMVVADEIDSEDEMDPEPKRRDAPPRAKQIVSRTAVGDVHVKKDEIIAAMDARDTRRALQLVRKLVEFQLTHSGPERTAKSLCALAMEAQERRLFKVQLELTTRSTKVAPGDDWSWMQHGKALLNLNRPAGALDAYDRALYLQNSAPAHNGRAEVLKAMGGLPEALAAYEAAIAAHPENPVAKSGRAEVLKAMDRLPEALAAYDAALAAHPENLIAKNGRAEVLKAMGQLPEALAAYNRALAAHPEDPFAKSGRAEVLKAMGQLPEALAAYDAALAAHPENPIAKNGRAEVLKAMGRLPEALAAYDAALAAHPEDPFAKNGRAEVLKAMGQLPKALAAYDAALAAHPEDSVAKCGRAEVLKATGRLPEALAAYDAALAAHPEDPVAKNGRAEVLKAMGRLPEALVAYEAALAAHPEDPFAKSGRAEILKAMGRLPEALAAYDAALAAQPEDPFAKSGRAEILKAMGRLPEALGAYEAALYDQPWNATARSGLACALAGLERFDEALAQVPEVLPVSLDDWVGHHVRGMILMRRGDAASAMRIFEAGVNGCLFALQRDYFRSALVVARLRKKQFQAAADVLAEVRAPLLQVQADVLRVHCYGELGRPSPAMEAFRRLPEQGTDVLMQLRAELRRRFIDQNERPMHDEQWLFDREVEYLMAA